MPIGLLAQSENMKTGVYESPFWMPSMTIPRKQEKYWDNKILGLGSPKLDKVLHAKERTIYNR